MTDISVLFRPFELGNLTLANRIVMAPMTRNLSPGNIPNEKSVEYYRRRAAGGVGLIIAEGTCVDHIAASGYPDVPYFHGSERLEPRFHPDLGFRRRGFRRGGTRQSRRVGAAPGGG